jgi:hypothetical protein
MEDSAQTELEAKLLEIKGLHVEEATQRVNASNTSDAQAYGVHLVETFQQVLHGWMWLSCKTGTSRGKALDIGGARVALAQVHSGEYIEKVLACIIEAEELATKIFIAEK